MMIRKLFLGASLSFSGLLISLTSITAQGDDVVYRNNDLANKFVIEMVEDHGFEQAALEAWFAGATKKQSILDAIARPAEKRLTWAEYRKIFVTDSRINKGVDFWNSNEDTLNKVEQEFGVPAAVIVAIIGVETRYGENKGSFRVIDALSTLAFDYPPRSKFFTKELKEFLLLSREQKQDPLKLIGSYAGAMGYGQFIPSSYRAYAIDYDKDGFADIWNNTDDAIGSVANYFKVHGWKTNEDVVVRSRIADNIDESVINDSLKPSITLGELNKKGFTPVKPTNNTGNATAMRLEGEWGAEFWLGLHNFYVITRYNHNRLYAMAVWQLSQEILSKKTSS
jgi:membrane-bound lytic murein transglycosylase B